MDFQQGLWVLEVSYHFKAGAVNIIYYVLLAAILKLEKR